MILVREISCPSKEPITVEEAKEHMRVDLEVDDGYIERLIKQARYAVEAHTSLVLGRRNFLFTFDHFPFTQTPIILPRAPLISVKEVRYLSPSGEFEVWSDEEYQVSTGTPGRIAPKGGKNYPALGRGMARVEIEAAMGHYRPPERAKQIMLFLVSEWYENRELTTPQSSGSIPVNYATAIRSLRWYGA